MYDKHGCVLRIETVINHPYEYRVRRRGKRNSMLVTGWFPMVKRVTCLDRYAEVCRRANTAYLDALAVVDDPAPAFHSLHQVREPTMSHGRRKRGLNPLRKCDVALFAAVLRGEHLIHGFRNRDLAQYLAMSFSSDPLERKRQSARITRLIQLLHTHRLIAKIPHSRRYRLTMRGASLMSASVYLYRKELPGMVQSLAA